MPPDGSLHLLPVRAEPLDARAARPPRLAPDLVPRPRLLRRLAAARDVPVVLIVAPAGYGKTTLLAEWAAREERRFEWVAAHRLGRAGAGERVLERLVGEGPAVVVVDDAQQAAGAAIDELVDAACRLPAGSTLALASRRPLGPRLARLRAHRLVLALGRADLAMTSLEAALLLQAEGLRLEGEAVDRLVTRTQGWPAVLAIAAEALAERPGQRLGAGERPGRGLGGERPGRDIGGADRVLADYLRGEVLAELPAHRLAFLRRTAVLPELTPRLCDAILGRGDASRVLEAIARADVGLEPVGRLGDRYRLHPLVRELLLADLERLEPGLRSELHRRAATWHGRHGSGEAAVEHAIGAGDPAAAGHALWALAPRRAIAGQPARVASWLRAFSERDVAAHPELAMTAAVLHLADGRLKEAERWTATADGAARWAARGPARTAALALLRACAGSGGVADMGADAARAAALMPAEQPWQALASLLRGAARHLAGDREAARALLARAARPGPGDLALVRALAHAQLALLDAEVGDWEAAAAGALAARHQLDGLASAQDHASANGLASAPPVAANGLVSANGLASAPPVAALVPVVAAVTAAYAGDLPEARRAADQARRLLADDSALPTWLAVECEVWLARAEIRLSDAAAARALLARAARLLRASQDAPSLAAWLHAGWERADAFAVGATGELPALTTAELRVLRFLPSHLTFREIGDRLHVSANTVKTQALAAYRKLDVGCRSEAVARGRAVGLIDG